MVNEGGDFKVILSNTYAYLQGSEHYALFPMLKIWIHEVLNEMYLRA